MNSKLNYFEDLISQYFEDKQSEKAKLSPSDSIDEEIQGYKITTANGEGILARDSKGRILWEQNGKIYLVNQLRRAKKLTKYQQQIQDNIQPSLIVLGLVFLAACSGGGGGTTTTSIGAGVAKTAQLLPNAAVSVTGSAGADNIIIDGNITPSVAVAALVDFGEALSATQFADSVTITSSALKNLGGKTIILNRFGANDAVILKTSSGNLGVSDVSLDATNVSLSQNNGSWSLLVDLDGVASTTNDRLTLQTDIATTQSLTQVISSGSTIIHLDFAPSFVNLSLQTLSAGNLSAQSINAGVKAFESDLTTFVSITDIPSDVVVLLNNAVVNAGTTMNVLQFNGLQYRLAGTATGINNNNDVMRITLNDGINAPSTGTITFTQAFNGVVGADGILNGSSGNDVLNLAANSLVSATAVNVMAGNGDDMITTGAGNDVIRGGAGRDVINAGAGNDIIVMVGRGYSKTYTDADLLQSITVNGVSQTIDLGAKIGLTTAELNNSLTTDFSLDTDIVSTGDGFDTIILFGDFDMAQLSVTDLSANDVIKINSKARITAYQLNRIMSLGIKIQGSGDSEIIISSSTEDGGNLLNISAQTKLSGFGKLTLGNNLEVNIASIDRFNSILSNGGIVNSLNSATNLAPKITIDLVANSLSEITNNLLNTGSGDRFNFSDNIKLATMSGTTSTSIVAEQIGAQRIAADIKFNSLGGLDIVNGQDGLPVYGTAFADVFAIKNNSESKIATGKGRDIITIAHSSLTSLVSITDFNNDDKVVISGTTTNLGDAALQILTGHSLSEFVQSAVAGNLELTLKRAPILAPVTKFIQEIQGADTTQSFTGKLNNFASGANFVTATNYGSLTIDTDGDYSYVISGTKLDGLVNNVQDVFAINIASTATNLAASTNFVVNLFAVNDETKILTNGAGKLTATAGNETRADTGLSLTIADADSTIVKSEIVGDNRFVIAEDNKIYLQSNTYIGNQASLINLLVRATDIYGKTNDKFVQIQVGAQSGTAPIFNGKAVVDSSAQFLASSETLLAPNAIISLTSSMSFAGAQLKLIENNDSEFSLTIASASLTRGGVAFASITSADDANNDLTITFNSLANANDVQNLFKSIKVRDINSQTASTNTITWQLTDKNNGNLFKLQEEIFSQKPNIAPVISGANGVLPAMASITENANGIAGKLFNGINIIDDNVANGIITITNLNRTIGSNLQIANNNRNIILAGSVVGVIDEIQNGLQGQNLQIKLTAFASPIFANTILQQIEFVSQGAPIAGASPDSKFLVNINDGVMATSFLQSLHVDTFDHAPRLVGLDGDIIPYTSASSKIWLDRGQDGAFFDGDKIGIGTKLIFSSANAATKLLLDGALQNGVILTNSATSATDGDLIFQFTSLSDASVASDLLHHIQYQNTNNALTGNDLVSVSVINANLAEPNLTNIVKLQFAKNFVAPVLPAINGFNFQEDAPAIGVLSRNISLVPGQAVSSTEFIISLTTAQNGKDGLTVSQNTADYSFTKLNDRAFQLKFGSAADITDYLDALNSINYSASADFSNGNMANIKLTVIDRQSVLSNYQNIGINLLSKNDAPTITGSSLSLNIPEESNNNAPLSGLLNNIGVFTDEEAQIKNNYAGSKLEFLGANGALTDRDKISFDGYDLFGISLTKNGIFYGSFINNILQFNDNVDAPAINNITHAVRYTNNGIGNFTGANSASAQMSQTMGLITKFYDNENAFTSITQNITLTYINDAPIITNPFFVKSFQDSAGAQGNSDLTGILAATDEETPQGLIYTIGSLVSSQTNFGTLSLDSRTGRWNFDANEARIDQLSASEHVAFSFNLRVSDGHSFASQTLILGFDGVNDAPVIISNTNSVSQLLDSPNPESSIANISGVISATDAEGANLIYSVSANNNNEWGIFTINSVTGAWVFDANEAKIDSLGTGEAQRLNYKLNAVADGVNSSTEILITIIGANDAPTISGVNFSFISFRENDNGITAPTNLIFGQSADFKDLEAETTNYSGAKIEFTHANGVLTNQEKISFDGYTIIGNLLTKNNVNYGIFTNNILQFSSNVNSQTIDEIIHSVRYTNNGVGNFTGANSGAGYIGESINLTVKFTDKENAVASLSQNISVIHENDAPIITNQFFVKSFHDSAGAQGNSDISGALIAFDEETPQGLIYTIGSLVSSQTDFGTLTIDSQTGRWSFDANEARIDQLSAREHVAFSFNLRVSDGHSFASQTLILIFGGVNDAPIIQSYPSNVIVINDTSAVAPAITNFSGVFSASDAEGASLTYLISNTSSSFSDDWGVLTINSLTGNWVYDVNEAKLDTLGSGRQKQLSYLLAAFDGDISATREVVVVLNGANDAPTFATTPIDAFIIRENNSTTSLDISGSVTAVDIDADSLINYTIGGALSSQTEFGTLTINSATGVWQFDANEARIASLSIDTSPIIDFRITASDGSVTISQQEKISIIGVTIGSNTDTGVFYTDGSADNIYSGTNVSEQFNYNFDSRIRISVSNSATYDFAGIVGIGGDDVVLQFDTGANAADKINFIDRNIINSNKITGISKFYDAYAAGSYTIVANQTDIKFGAKKFLVFDFEESNRISLNDPRSGRGNLSLELIQDNSAFLLTSTSSYSILTFGNNFLENDHQTLNDQFVFGAASSQTLTGKNAQFNNFLGLMGEKVFVVENGATDNWFSYANNQIFSITQPDNALVHLHFG